MDPRARLLERIGDINDFSRPRPLVTLEEFFTGNDDYGSIGYNLPEQPSPQEFFQILRRIRDRENVADVRIEVQDHEDPQGWPSSDTVWIVTSALADDVTSWLPDAVKPDDLVLGFGISETKTEPYELPANMNAIGIWYD